MELLTKVKDSLFDLFNDLLVSKVENKIANHFGEEEQQHLATAVLLILLLNGLFHFFGSEQALQEYSPDWVISRHLLNKNGLDLAAHRAVGLMLIFTSLYYLQGKSFDEYYRTLIAPLTLIVLAVGVFLKLFELNR